MKAQLELLPRPHCNLCAIDMWLVPLHGGFDSLRLT
jgi:hypothetical protein